MPIEFSERMKVTQKSFIREILKVTLNPQVISFAGGLPNPSSFPIHEIKQASEKVLNENGNNVLQYSTTEGYLPLREYISNRYMKKGIKVIPEEILITNGSQQGLDLLGKIFINQGDKILIERPGYLGAIQAFSIFEPDFHSVPLQDDGVNTHLLEEIMNAYHFKLFYGVPNFQNPSGITYSAEKRKKVAEIFSKHRTFFVEDDPYGELRFMGENSPSMKEYMGEKTILLGSFSKIVAPAMRIGWICAKKEIMEKLIIAKQASDLHTNYFSQRVVYQYLLENDLDAQIEKIRNLYKGQRDCMVAMIEKYFPKEVKYTKPEGGMFLWVTLPEGFSSLELFDIAAKDNVAFVPGDPFYTNEKNTNTLRLNYSNCDKSTIEEGIKRLSKAILQLIND